MKEELRQLLRNLLVFEELHKNLVLMEYSDDDEGLYAGYERVSVVWEVRKDEPEAEKE